MAPSRFGKWSASSKQPCLFAGGGFQTELAIAQFGGDAPLRCAFEVTLHDQVRLVDFLQSVGFLANGDREGTYAHRTAAELGDDRFKDALVHFVEAVFVDFEDGKSGIR